MTFRDAGGSHTHRRAGDSSAGTAGLRPAASPTGAASSLPRPGPGPGPGPAAHEPPVPPPRAPPVGPFRARPPADATPGSARAAAGGSPEFREEESFTEGWAPRRQCPCSQSPARFARALGRRPDPRGCPPSWLEAEEPAERGAAGTTGASGRWREREGAGPGRGGAGRGVGRDWAGRRAR